jgi:hypothetical protein
MDLTTYEFPELTGADIAFSTEETRPDLLEEAKKRGFNNHNNPYCKLFSEFFFNGGKLVFKESLSEEFKTKAWNYCQALMFSYKPKHEHKQAVCAMLMSELIDLNSYETI